MSGNARYLVGRVEVNVHLYIRSVACVYLIRHACTTSLYTFPCPSHPNAAASSGKMLHERRCHALRSLIIRTPGYNTQIDKDGSGVHLHRPLSDLVVVQILATRYVTM